MVVASPIGWRPAHWVAISSFSEQRLPRWLWSISKALGRVTAIDLMLASPGRVVRSNCRAGLAARGSPCGRRAGDRHLRLEGKRGAVDGVEVGGEVGDRALVADPLGGDAKRIAVGRVDHELGLVDVDLDRAHPERDAADDRGHGFGVGDDVGVERVDVEGDADDDGAVVIGAGEGRRDRRRGRAGRPGRGRRGRSCRPRGRDGCRGRRRRWRCRSAELAGQLGVACSTRPGCWAAAAIEASGQ